MLESEIHSANRMAKALALTVLGLHIAGILLLGLVWGVFEPYDLHPTYDELADHGYYAYVVPPSLAAEYGWREETSIWRWGKHCSISQDNRFNPLKVDYFDEQGTRIFQIELTLWGSHSIMNWMPREERVQVPFDAKWAKAGTLEMIHRSYEDSEVIYLSYEDWYGTPVYVTSHLPLVDTLSLLHTLNYVGAPQEQAAPWTC